MGSARKHAELEHGKCFACGERKADAYWHGFEIEMSICRACAIDVLPKLIADAVAYHEIDCLERTPSPNDLADALRTIQAEFWRAVALAACGAFHRKRESA